MATDQKIAIVGATGFVGSAVVKEALDRGYRVTALARNPEKLNLQHERLITVKADVFNVDELAEVLKGHDAVISTYNPGWTNPNIYADYLKGSRAVQEGVKKSGVQRFVVVGGAGSLYVAPGVQLIDTPEFPAEYKPGALAAREYLEVIKQEDRLDWTFVSPAIEMHPGTSGERRGTYRTDTDSPVFDTEGRSVLSVEDLAVAIVDEVEEGRYVRQRFTAAY